MTLATNLGFPRIGRHRELKRALEDYWAGKSDAATLLHTARGLRASAWHVQAQAGLAHVPSHDFSLYDHVLDMVQVLGATPARYRVGDALASYFAMARGASGERIDLRPLEMTKWFDTNYHYLVPELDADMALGPVGDAPVLAFLEAAALGVHTRPVLLGPLSFLLLGKLAGGGDPTLLVDRLLPAYETLLARLGRAGATWVQLDEPCLVTDLPASARAAYRRAYDRLAAVAAAPKLLVATYFGALGENLPLATTLPVAGLHVDLVRAPEQAEAVAAALPKAMVLSAGVVDGRNVWRTDLDAALRMLRRVADLRAAAGAVDDALFVAPSCSLLHVPVDLGLEKKLDAELRGWLAFAGDRLDEVVALAAAVDGRMDPGHDACFLASRRAIATRRASARVHDPAVAARLAALAPTATRRASGYAARRDRQRALGLPVFPTTTIGSFPQTAEVRAARAELRTGKRDQRSYEAFVRAETEKAVRWQEQVGLDVLVDGEFERNDMVEFFGERLLGFAFTEHGWVQSYGSRCVKPPVLYGDVSRPAPMTVATTAWAQSLTRRPVKGMLTGPVTILHWSFVRADQPRATTCAQIALAIRDEVADLEKAGLRVIQIDEPAIREGLPLRRAERASYLAWAVDCFRLAAAVAGDDTQIHTHMCYAEFNDIIDAVAAMDADVVSLESSRSKMELLEAFRGFRYPNEVGPGVYDIHSPRVPSEDEMVDLLRRAARVLPARQIWVNPDCGLKTRRWDEVEPAIQAMVRAARRVRAESQGGASGGGGLGSGARDDRGGEEGA